MDGRLENREAHTFYFELLAEQGIIGFMVFMFMLVFLFRGTFRAKALLRELRRDDLAARVTALQFGLTGFLVASLFLHSAYPRYMYLLIGMVAACSAFAENQMAAYETNKEYGSWLDS